MKACFSRHTVPAGSETNANLIDYRYFYEFEGRGSYTCGLARNAVAQTLQKLGEYFADTDFLISLRDNMGIRSVAGFMIKQAVLESIRSKGLTIASEIGTCMTVKPIRNLSGPLDYGVDIRHMPVLYRPEGFNFKTIDGIIILVKPEEKNVKGKKENAKGKKEENAEPKPKLLMFPLQITLSSHRKNSHARFFKEYGKWTRGLEYFDVVPEFLWITPVQHPPKHHKKCSKWPAHEERFINFENVSKDIWTRYQGAKRYHDVHVKREKEEGAKSHEDAESDDEESDDEGGAESGDEESAKSSDEQAAGAVRRSLRTRGLPPAPAMLV
jgi:hypothetical protein